MILNILFGLGFVGMAIISFSTIRENRKLTRKNQVLHDGLRRLNEINAGLKSQALAALRERDLAVAERRKIVALHTTISAGDAQFDAESQQLARPEATTRDVLHIGGFPVTQLDPRAVGDGFPETRVEVHRR